ncbi:tetratricopeptide repeat protein [Phenylobacterium sp.]|uniref:tetratricopeptide repeat protein n=1 Tax=Phenylobacterium sp. TaxID=1871053 RepID=UPI002ED7D848
MITRWASLALTVVLLAAGPSAAKPSAEGTLTAAGVAEIRRAIDEQRLLDAGRMIDQAMLGGVTDPRLSLLGGDLNLVRKRYNVALTSYRMAEGAAETRAQSLQGQGLALALLGRSTEALEMLKRAVAEDPKAWRAWNALGAQYDTRGDWTASEAAYAQAMANSGGAPQVLNNRGYSRLLQSRRDEAVADLVAALQKKPDMSEARTNLRVALAMGGDYERAVSGASADERAALLNNAGFAAGVRGDYAKAEELLNQALKVKSEYYARASENLKIVRALAAQNGANATPHAAP